MQILIITLLVFVIAIVWVLAYNGAFARIVIKERLIEDTYFIYGVHTGEYSKISIPMENLYKKLLNEENLPTTRGLGIYYDDPKQVEGVKLRSVYGCVIDNHDLDRLETLRAKGYPIGILRKSKALTADFPFNSPLSIIIGIFRIYPALGQYQAAHSIPGKPVIELYDTPAKKITYIVPVEIPNNELIGLLGVVN